MADKFVLNSRVKMVMPREDEQFEMVYGFYKGETFDGYALVKWDHLHAPPLNTFPEFLMPEDQPHQEELVWLQKKKLSLQHELELLQFKLQRACDHPTKWGSLEEGGVYTTRCPTCGKTLS